MKFNKHFRQQKAQRQYLKFTASLNTPFPHSRKRRHQLKAWADKTQRYVWSCDLKPRPPSIVSKKKLSTTLSNIWDRWELGSKQYLTGPMYVKFLQIFFQICRYDVSWVWVKMDSVQRKTKLTYSVHGYDESISDFEKIKLEVGFHIKKMTVFPWFSSAEG